MFGKLDEVGGFAELDMQPILARAFKWNSWVMKHTTKPGVLSSNRQPPHMASWLEVS